jgi:hypothetical protein
LSRADWGDQPAAACEQALRDLGEPRHDPGGDDSAGEKADPRGRDQHRIETKRASRILGERRAVHPQLPQADDRQHDEHEVDAESLGQGPADLPRETSPDAGRVATGREGREGERDDARRRGGTGSNHHAGIDLGRRRDPRLREWPDQPQDLNDAHGNPRRDECRWDREQDRLAERHGGQMQRARSAGPEQSSLDAAPFDQHPGDEQDRVGGEDRELDRQQQHAGPADQRRAVDARQDARQLRGDT